VQWGTPSILCEVVIMSYIDPKLRSHFESLSVDLKNEILKRDVKLYTLNDLIKCLEGIVAEA
jgi:hypothetical protein